MAITNKMAVALRQRDPYCLHCGADINLQIHHRRNRGMGSSKLLDTFQNLIRVCAMVNFAMESDAKVAQEARDFGWKLGQWGDFDSPVFDKVQQTWFALDAKGNKTLTDPPNYLI